jgi:Integrase core domain
MAEACRKIDAGFREGAARLVRETGRPVRGRHRVRHRRGQALPRLGAGRGLAPGTRSSLSEHHDAELAHGALAVRGGAVPGVIMHTDQGSKYTVRLFRWPASGFPSASRWGGQARPINAMIESWHSTMVWEPRSRVTFATSALPRTVIAAWIEDCNTKRRHSACGVMPPVAWEAGLRRRAGGRVSAVGRCAARDQEGGGFAAAHFPARRAGYGVAPPALRVLRIALRATAPRAALDPGDLAPGGRKSGQAQGLPPAIRAARNPRGGGPARRRVRQGKQVNWRFDSQKDAENDTNPL